MLSAFVLASPGLTFAGAQPARVYTPNRNETRNAVHTTRVVDERAAGAKAPRSEKGAPEAQPAAHATFADSAFRK